MFVVVLGHAPGAISVTRNLPRKGKNVGESRLGLADFRNLAHLTIIVGPSLVPNTRARWNEKYFNARLDNCISESWRRTKRTLFVLLH